MKKLIENGTSTSPLPLYLVKKVHVMYAWNDDELRRLIEQFKGASGSDAGIACSYRVSV